MRTHAKVESGEASHGVARSAETARMSGGREERGHARWYRRACRRGAEALGGRGRRPADVLPPELGKAGALVEALYRICCSDQDRP